MPEVLLAFKVSNDGTDKIEMAIIHDKKNLSMTPDEIYLQIKKVFPDWPIYVEHFGNTN